MKLCIAMITLLLPVVTVINVTAQRVAINTTGTAPDVSAILDVQSTNRGLLIPRMTNDNKKQISLPASGLLIYQVDSAAGLYYNLGTPASPNWQRLGLAGPVLTNGTAGGQIYVTGTASPYAPQSPQSVSGDVTISAGAVTTISGGAVTTAKIADDAVTSAKIPAGAVGTSELASGSVTIPKIGTTNSASATTFLRGDGSWAAPVAGGAVALVANSTAAQTLPGSTAAPSGTTVSFNTATTSAFGTFTGNTTFTATVPGAYLVTVHLTGSANNSISPFILVNNNVVAYGTGIANSFFPAPISRSEVMTVVSLAAGDDITIKASIATQSNTQSLTTDGSTNLTIVKL